MLYTYELCDEEIFITLKRPISDLCPLGWIQHGRKCWALIENDTNPNVHFFAAQKACTSKAIEDGFDDGILLNFMSLKEANGIAVCRSKMSSKLESIKNWNQSYFDRVD